MICGENWAETGKSREEMIVRSRIESIDLGKDWQWTPENTLKARAIVPDNVTSLKVATCRTFGASSLEELSGFRRFIMRPDCACAILLDVIGALLILYDMYVIPLGVFPLPDSALIDTVGVLTMVFWTLSIFTTPFIGIYKSGALVMIPSEILRNYVRLRPSPGWVWLDVPIVAADWVIFVVLDGNGGQVALFRAVRLVRLSRLLRVGKLKKVADIIDDYIDSEYVSILANILQMILTLLFINHVIACGWYYVSDMQRGDAWIDHHGFRDDAWTYQYAVAFHWGITQFTPSSMHVQPQCADERVFAITVVVFALVGFSYIVGSISGSLARLRGMHEETAKQFWDLRQYLKKNRIPKRLSTEARRYIEQAWMRQLKTKPLKDIKIFALLSQDLRHKIEICQFRGHLLKHPLFHHLNHVCNNTLPRLADAVHAKRYFEDEKVFSANTQAEYMYFISQGHLQYENRVTGDTEDLCEGDGDYWIAEHCLWMQWRHLGNLVPRKECRLLLLDPSEFAKILTAQPQAYHVGMIYARHFHESLKHAPEMSDVEDGTKLLQHKAPWVSESRSGTKSL